jgi:hypothetical protein
VSCHQCEQKSCPEGCSSGGCGVTGCASQCVGAAQCEMAGKCSGECRQDGCRSLAVEKGTGSKYIVEEGEMSMQRKCQSNGVSRRKFLRDGGLIAGGVAALGIGSLALTGCSVATECQTASQSAADGSPQTNIEYFGECVCPNCGSSQPHPRGVPCRMIKCLECGVNMGRGAV